MKIYGSISRLVSVMFRKDGQDLTVRPNQATTLTAARDIQLPPGDADHVLVAAAATQTLTNKTIDGDDNTIQDLALASLKTVLGDAAKVLVRDGSGAVVSAALADANIAADAAIDATKIGAGTVSSTEFGYLDGVTSAIQTQLSAKLESSLKGAANGLAELDSNGKVPAAQLPASVMDFKGSYDADANSPSLADGTGDAGDVYRVAVAGTRDFGAGSISGSVWQRSPGADFTGFAATALNNLSVASLAAGSLLVGSSASAVAALPIGTEGQVLKVVQVYDEMMEASLALSWETVTLTNRSGNVLWAPADGTSKVFTHNLGSSAVHVAIYDFATKETIFVDSVVRTSDNVVTLTASEAPTGTGWVVTVFRNN
jgi:hypothetical protein